MFSPISLLLGWGVPAKFVKPLLFLAGAVILLLVIRAGVAIHDHGVISNHDAKTEAAAAKADRTADEHAAVQRRADDERVFQETLQLDKVQTNAHTDADRRLAKHRCLRLQQSARANGLEPPTCV